jgi:hypothetical protein
MEDPGEITRWLAGTCLWVFASPIFLPFSFPISLRKFRLSMQERMFPDRSKSRPNGPHTSAKKFRVPLLKQTGNVL